LTATKFLRGQRGGMRLAALWAWARKSSREVEGEVKEVAAVRELMGQRG
jgi:hypothetical protein